MKKKFFLVAEIEKFFHELDGPIQAVVVVAAAENVEGSSGPIETSINSYPALLSRDFYILTVGAVMASASGSKKRTTLAVVKRVRCFTYRGCNLRTR